MAGMPASGAMAGSAPKIPSITDGDLTNRNGDFRTGAKRAGTLVFGNNSESGNNNIIYIAAALIGLFLLKGKK
ncbi:MAG: hypothetical protein QM500_02880 [Methylococcales bacterium]